MAYQDTIHDVVRERYGTIAATGGSCCDTSCGCDVPLYDLRLLENLPDEVTSISLGCGETQL